jgi:hypothetical protein
MTVVSCRHTIFTTMGETLSSVCDDTAETDSLSHHYHIYALGL